MNCNQSIYTSLFPFYPQLAIDLHSDNMALDMVEFQRLENYEESEPDYTIDSSFPQEPEYSLRHLIDYRIKLLLKDEVVLESSETQLVATCCKISNRSPNLSMHLKGYEHLPVSFENEGIISSKFHGVVYVKLTNYSSNTVRLPPGAIVGYLILQPYSLS